MKVYQKEITLEPKSRGYHLITREIETQVPDFGGISTGIAHLHIMHTSAALALNENADPDVRHDFRTFFDRLVPENPALYQHTLEGPDDMTSHIKSSLLGSSLTLPVRNGRFYVGTWQGIYLCEHRNRGGARRLVLTVLGS